MGILYDFSVPAVIGCSVTLQLAGRAGAAVDANKTVVIFLT